MCISSLASVVAAWWSLSPSSSTASTVRLPLQPTTPHWETPSMAVRAIFLPVCHRRTAQGLPNWIQTMFGRAVFYSNISIDDINAQSGWSLKTEKIRDKKGSWAAVKGLSHEKGCKNFDKNLQNLT
jgi:hypothetical protein